MVGMQKRRTLLLLEMMIAMLIMVGVMSMVFAGFYSAIHNKNKIKIEKEKILRLQRLKLRFALLFKNVIDVKKVSEGAYYIKYRGGIDPNPDFRSDVNALLKLKNNNLILSCWAEKEEQRHELLSENVKELKLEFFDEKKGKFDLEYPKKKPRMMKVSVDKEVLPLFL
jgi:hypothetical protein